MENPDEGIRQIEFIQDIRLEDVRECIKGRNGYLFCGIRTLIQLIAKDIFPNPKNAPDPHTQFLWRLRRECRGIVFSKETGKVISRRFHKFFNASINILEVNETEETAAKNIKLDKPFVVLEKMDGSMISPYWTEGKLRFATKNGVTDTCLIVEEHIRNSGIDYVGFSSGNNAAHYISLLTLECKEWIEKGWTPTFEWCSRKSPIVLQYQQDSLNLIALRNIRTGEYLSFDKTVEIAKERNIPMVKAWKPEEFGLHTKQLQDFQTFYQQAQSKEGVEGFVLRFEDGFMLKIKTHWYFKLNKSIDLLRRAGEKHKWECVLNEKYDDMRGYLLEKEQQAMDEFMKDLLQGINNTAQVLVQQVNESKGKMNQKEFSDSLSNVPKAEKAIMFKIWQDIQESGGKMTDEDLLRNAVVHIGKYILANLGNKQKMESVRSLAGGINYDTYKQKYCPDIKYIKDDE